MDLVRIGKFRLVKVHLGFSFKNNISMDTDKINTFFQVIKLMASSYDEQVCAFPSFVIIPDEIALLFDDIYRDTKQMSKDKILSSDSANLLFKINDLFNNMSKDLTKWTLKSLKKDTDWNVIRDLAKSILEIQGIDNKNINLDFINWISS